MKKTTIVLVILFALFGMNQLLAQNVNQPGQPQNDSSRKMKGTNPSQSGLKTKGDTTNKWFNSKGDSLSKNNNNYNNGVADTDSTRKRNRNQPDKKYPNSNGDKNGQGGSYNNQKDPNNSGDKNSQGGSYNQKRNEKSGKRNGTSRDSVPR